jgi:hypothetical protein
MPLRSPDALFRRAIPLLLSLVLLLTAGGGTQAQGLDQAVSSYKARKDAASLEIIYQHLHKGMPRAKVEGLLGEADYSPIDGQEYYASQQAGPDQDKAGPTLVVDYRDAQGEVTDALHGFWLGDVGE